MVKPAFVTVGKRRGDIDVRLSYKIIDLFSENLYASPNKAIEELVANSFDAGARTVQVILSSNLHDQNATIVVIDDGEGMDAAGLTQHWLIGISNKRSIAHLPRGRQQIGKFGIGKLATYVLANELTHVTKQAGKYYAASMDYRAIDKRVEKEVEPKTAIKIPLRELSEAEAKTAVAPWTASPAFKASGMNLFGKKAPATWTVTVMSALKGKVHEIKPGTLSWILSTALPLRPDFGIWLNGKKLAPSKAGKGVLRRWVLGHDLVQLPRPSPKGITADENTALPAADEHRFGLNVPGIGRITGYAEAYKDLLTGKSDELGRSHGFFVYVFGRLVNVADSHFGIPADELRHGTFGRFRLVVHMDGLDVALRSNRETISEGPLLETTQDVLRAIFNAVRPTLERHDAEEEPGAKLARKMAASPASLSRLPIVDLARAAVERKFSPLTLVVPSYKTSAQRDDFIAGLEERAKEGQRFVLGLSLDYDASPESGIAQFDVATGILRINAWHPFVATFYDEFASKDTSQPLELFAMAEVLAEAHLYALGIKQELIQSFLSLRDQLLRNLANESGRESALSIANNLLNARNNPTGLEDKVCAAFRSRGFDVTPLRKKGQPDGVAAANLAAAADGKSQRYSISLEAKSKQKLGAKVTAKSVGISTIARQRDDFECDHAIVVGPAFPTTQDDKSALAKEIDDDRRRTAAENKPKSITLITIDDLARLVRLRPVKQVGLRQLRGLFDCRVPEDASKWVEAIRKRAVTKPPYKAIIEAIQALQKEFNQTSVTYSSLRVKLAYLTPPIKFETDEPLIDLCKAMAQMAPGGIYANQGSVELDQSPANVIAMIDSAMKEYPINEQ
jgi:hypothetical protein